MSCQNTQAKAALETSYSKGPTDTILCDQTIGQYFDHIVAKFPNQPALISSHQGIRWTYSEFQNQINCLATGLLALGIKPGDRVGIWSPNCAEWYLTQIATAKIGAIMVCVNPAYQTYELEYALNKVECKVLVTADRFKKSDYLYMLNQLAPELAGCEPGQLMAQKLPHLTTVIRLGNENTPGMFNFDAVCSMGGDAKAKRLETLKTALNCKDPINIQFTSGTTGSPKGATLSHHNILNNAQMCAKGMRLTENDKLCIPVPLYHCFGMVMGTLSCIANGACAVFPGPSFDPEETLAVVEKEGCTGLHGVPTMFIAQLEHPRFADFDLSTLRTGIMAGATCPVEVMKRVQSDMSMTEVLIGYGQTECSPLNHLTSPDDPLAKRVETVGRAVEHLEVKIIDDKGAILPIGQKGEICARGYAVMHGYWNDQEKTTETIDAEGWLHSGDIGIMDTDGYTQVVGRIKDMIIRGGENIYPREVEEFLYTHPGIKEVAVFGIPDEKYGEQVCAWIQPQDGAVLTAEEVKGFCKGRISHFKIPYLIELVDSYPMTVTGKIQKFKMRDVMVERRRTVNCVAI